MQGCSRARPGSAASFGIFARRQIGLIGLIVLLAGLQLGGQAAAGTHADIRTLDSVKDRGYLVCGVNSALPGFSSPDANGQWVGFDVDYCRAVAAAVFGDTTKVRYRTVSRQEGYQALQAREVDVLSRSISWSADLESLLGLRFVGVTFFDGQALLVRKELGVSSVLELSGTKVCVNSTLDFETNVVDYFTRRNMPFEILPFDRDEDALKAYDAHKCDVFTADTVTLTTFRERLAKPADHTILPEAISNEPLGPVIRQGDEQWYDVSRWTLYAMIAAEDLGLSSLNIKELRERGSSAIKHLLGSEGEIGPHLGLDIHWADHVIALVGNYAEVFDRNLGIASGIGLPRGFNNLWSHGGLLYAPAIR